MLPSSPPTATKNLFSFSFCIDDIFVELMEVTEFPQKGENECTQTSWLPLAHLQTTQSFTKPSRDAVNIILPSGEKSQPQTILLWAFLVAAKSENVSFSLPPTEQSGDTCLWKTHKDLSFPELTSRESSLLKDIHNTVLS